VNIALSGKLSAVVSLKAAQSAARQKARHAHFCTIPSLMAYSWYDHSVLERAEAQAGATALVDSINFTLCSPMLRRLSRRMFPLRAAVLLTAIEILGAPNNDKVHRGYYSRLLVFPVFLCFLHYDLHCRIPAEASGVSAGGAQAARQSAPVVFFVVVELTTCQFFHLVLWRDNGSLQRCGHLRLHLRCTSRRQRSGGKSHRGR
jgi:hypothetical protein